MVDKRVIEALEERVNSLGVDISCVKRAELSSGFKDEIPNIKGKKNSLKVLMAVADKQNYIGKDEALLGLKVFGDDLRLDAACNKGTHATIDLLESIVDGSCPKVKVDVVKHPVMESLPKDKLKLFREMGNVLDTPCFVYYENILRSNMKNLMSFPAPFGLIVRYAVKANSNSAILSLFDNVGAHFDASSLNECYRIMKSAGVPGNKIMLTSKEVLDPETIVGVVKKGVIYNACSLSQLENYGKAFPNSKVSVRFNLDIGSGWNNATNTGGVNAPFGIREQRDRVDDLLRQYSLLIERAHFHIGSGSNPEKQKEAAIKALDILRYYPSVNILNLGGGIKVARMNYEKATDIQDLGAPTRKALEDFAVETGRNIRLEIEPGTAAVANAGFIVSKVIDIVSTGDKGYEFLVLDAGMTENARIPMYGAQHPLVVIPADKSRRDIKEYVVVGPCCESGDVITPRPGNPETIDTRLLTEAKIGDIVVACGAGAYCPSMSGRNYNSHTACAEYLVRKNGNVDMIKKQQKLNDLFKDEVVPKDLRVRK